MNPVVYDNFRQILQGRGFGHVLEVGAQPPHPLILNCKELRGAICWGVDIGVKAQQPALRLLKANAHALPFRDEMFDTVVCNAMLEHDARFWFSCREMRRVLKTGGLLVIGVPGYTQAGNVAEVIGVHNYPGDYYRFSMQAVREVFFAGMEKPEMRIVLQPPRIIGWSVK